MSRGGVLFCAALVAGGVCALGPPDLAERFTDNLSSLSPAGDNAESASGSCRPVDGWDRRQMDNAEIIARVGREMDMPDRAIVVALATAMQESRLYNTTDRPPGEDSAGLFQQRPSQGWGSYDEVMDPEHAAGSFYRTLRRVDGWEDMRVTEAAQRVQRSAYPEAYQQHVRKAERLADALRNC